MVHSFTQVGVLGAALALAPLLVLIAQKGALSEVSDASPTPKAEAKEGLPFRDAVTCPSDCKIVCRCFLGNSSLVPTCTYTCCRSLSFSRLLV